ncbi:MAG: hypothetical protein SCH39_03990 [Methanosarcinales archaeon]|nr:hypothetical protein [Methanosarcinales archaeon]
MQNKRPFLLIILTLVIVLVSAGCLEKRGPQDPDVSMFELYVSDPGGVRVDDQVYSKGDKVLFVLKYHDVENFNPIEISNIQYEFSRLKPVDMDVHQGFELHGIAFLDNDGNSLDTVTLNPGESVFLSLVIPDMQEKWDEITARFASNESVQFELVLKMRDLAVPLQSNELTVSL